MNALAYAQGNDIHLAPSREQHLPHEAWHVVQRCQSRVQETMQVGGMGVNDDAGLEQEADQMGAMPSLQPDPAGHSILVTEMTNRHVGDDSAAIGTLAKQQAQVTDMVATCEGRVDDRINLGGRLERTTCHPGALR